MIIQILKLERIANQIVDWLSDIEDIEEQNVRNIQNLEKKVLRLKIELARLKEMYQKREEEIESKNAGGKARE